MDSVDGIRPGGAIREWASRGRPAARCGGRRRHAAARPCRSSVRCRCVRHLVPEVAGGARGHLAVVVLGKCQFDLVRAMPKIVGVLVRREPEARFRVVDRVAQVLQLGRGLRRVPDRGQRRGRRRRLRRWNGGRRWRSRRRRRGGRCRARRRGRRARRRRRRAPADPRGARERDLNAIRLRRSSGAFGVHPVARRLRRRELAPPPSRAAPGQDAADQPEWRRVSTLPNLLTTPLRLRIAFLSA